MGRGRALQSATVRLFGQIGKRVFVLACPPDTLRAQTVAQEGQTGDGEESQRVTITYGYAGARPRMRRSPCVGTNVMYMPAHTERT